VPRHAFLRRSPARRHLSGGALAPVDELGAAVIEKGSPFACLPSYELYRLDALDLVDQHIPRPETGQVLVRVRASSLNFRDPVIASGKFPFPASPGFIALSDGAGEIEAIGAGVTRFAVGDRVVNSFLYVLDLDGWLAE
jgi:Zn-dependent alcohol dehydrogenase